MPPGDTLVAILWSAAKRASQTGGIQSPSPSHAPSFSHSVPIISAQQHLQGALHVAVGSLEGHLVGGVIGKPHAA